MAAKRRTRCVLCGNLCGLEVEVEDNRIVRVRADKEHLRSQGYVCRKGTAVAHYQHHADRLLYPMKKVGDTFERVSWDQALDEIAEKLKAIVDAHSPRSLALMGGATLASTVQSAFGLAVRRRSLSITLTAPAAFSPVSPATGGPLPAART